MTLPPSSRDAELLSAYLDGELSKDARIHLEVRLEKEPQLKNILDLLHSSRTVLGRLPIRKAPRNFTLTVKSAGIRPPLPRIFPIFRFASALAAALFLFVFAANLSVPAFASIPTRSGDVSIQSSAPMLAPAMRELGGEGVEAPAVTENEAPSAPAAPAVSQADNFLDMTDTPEMSLLQVDPTEAYLEKSAPTGITSDAGPQAKMLPENQSLPQPSVELQPIQLPIPATLQLGLLGLAVLSGSAAFFIQRSGESAWFKANKLPTPKPAIRQVVYLIFLLLLVLLLIGAVYLVSVTTFYAPVT